KIPSSLLLATISMPFSFCFVSKAGRFFAAETTSPPLLLRCFEIVPVEQSFPIAIVLPDGPGARDIATATPPRSPPSRHTPPITAANKHQTPPAAADNMSQGQGVPVPKPSPYGRHTPGMLRRTPKPQAHA